MAIDAGLERLRHAVLERVQTMIVKFHPRGRGGGAGPVDYLLGKDRQRDGATVLQGSRKKSGAYRRLALRKKYTSGVLSFAERIYRPGSAKS